jgi:ABC-type tungstate transport system substrate-binding protein
VITALLNVLFVMVLAAVGVTLFCLLSWSHGPVGLLALMVGALASVIAEEVMRWSPSA